MSCHTQNTIQNVAKPQSQTDKYGKSGIYQMKFLDCPLKYIGQTGQTFHITKELVQAVRSNNSNSGYSNHILNTRHTYGTVTDTVDIIEQKGKEGILTYFKSTTYTKSVKVSYT